MSTEPWNADLDDILRDALRANNVPISYVNPRYSPETMQRAAENAVVGCPGAEIRTLMTRAWRAGYKAGRKRGGPR